MPPTTFMLQKPSRRLTYTEFSKVLASSCGRMPTFAAEGLGHAARHNLLLQLLPLLVGKGLPQGVLISLE